MNHLKRFFIASIALLVIACNNTPKQSSISGEIKNLPKEVTEVLLRTPSQVKKIKIENGSFKDTINVDGKFCFIKIGQFQKTLFLDKETQLKINLDAKDYDNSLTYSGHGKRANDYLNKREIYTQEIFEKIDSINNLEPDAFKDFKLNMVGNIESLFKGYADINPYIIKTEKENLDFFVKNLEQQYNAINGVEQLKKGDQSPEFNDYENYKGGKTSLKDLRGNYVYIDVWATWCGPCKVEIPYLKKLEEKFHKKNIKFVSISVDNKNAKEAWKKMIQEKEMGGIQLFANGDQEFTSAYNVTGIPRFILLDTEGKIISANAPRPSSNQINDLLKSLP
ncbi:TlpA family protein disulfide reductase [Wenyingzhuangia marina]|uniref:Thiol-disulfide isomerase or thioredoxin n=1 Tax=Wenyingzhuangia marina TaxID=1195760 RepID=A0A1M5VZT1_9FLAO|nr:TlpA disulfide reductase family protein [Wenyingzhuangia marina]GGF76823.1 hypothetical protein GCM10011397_19770 [Wenyingzhuangia marina]SHH80766.1 Thiol-disulfide isomerase or thioredoxin [Wenyingzhuangia marina]